eukprot:SAG31_NODE_25_length_33055_cov_11.407919_12_plen_71_part_00
MVQLLQFQSLNGDSSRIPIGAKLCDGRSTGGDAATVITAVTRADGGGGDGGGGAVVVELVGSALSFSCEF